MRRKLLVVVQSRANYGRIKTVLKAAQRNDNIQLQIIVGASAILQKYGNVAEIMREDGFVADGIVYSIVEGESLTTMAKSTGLAIIELASHFERLEPDVVLTVADRFETMATAIASSYMNIPLAHTQGGEVTGSIDESVRHAITKLAHIHFPATERAAKFLLKMGENPLNVHLTGCPSMDILDSLPETTVSNLFAKYSGVGPELNGKEPYLLVVQHPVTTEYGQGLGQINETLKAAYRLSQNDHQIVWLWPNVDAGSDDVSKGIRVFREKHDSQKIHFYKNFSPEDYALLLKNSQCIIGNSSSGIREASYLGVPCVNIGSRQIGRERAENVIDVPHDAEKIYDAVLSQIGHGPFAKSTMFGSGSAGDKIIEILTSAELSINKSLTYLDEEAML